MLAVARPQIDVEDLGLDFARRRRDAVSSAAPSPDTMSASFSPPEPTSREIVIEPVGQRGVEIDEIAVGIDREEPAGA